MAQNISLSHTGSNLGEGFQRVCGVQGEPRMKHPRQADTLLQWAESFALRDVLSDAKL